MIYVGHLKCHWTYQERPSSGNVRKAVSMKRVSGIIIIFKKGHV